MKKNLRMPQTWTDYSHLRWSGKEALPSRMGKNKFSAYLLKKNLPHLKLISEFRAARNIDLSSTPTSFVLKPSNLWSSKGVMILHKIPSTSLFFDAMSKNVLTLNEIIKKQMELEKTVDKELIFQIEERALDEDENCIIPLDYKLFTFYGEVKFILQVDRNHISPRVNFFDGMFNEISNGNVYIPEGSSTKLGSARRPLCSNQLIDLAKLVTTDLEIPFVSVDCYATKNGACYGELTHTPGGPWYGSMYRFSNEFDMDLGRAWRNSLEKLGKHTELISVP